MPLGRNPKGAAEWAVAALGVILTLIGVVLVVGGGMLIAAGGSWYYLLAGLGLAASGVLMFRQRLLGAWVYLGVFVATVLWALWEVGLDGWGLVPRVIAPAVLLVFVIASLLVLKGGRPGRRWAIGGGIAFVVLMGPSGVIVAQANRFEIDAPLPGAAAVTSSDPGAIPVGADWPAYGGSYHAQRYSTLSQITPENVGRLAGLVLPHR